jgi:cation:H+ antiporter
LLGALEIHFRWAVCSTDFDVGWADPNEHLTCRVLPMTIFASIALLVVGLALLAGGGEALVRAATTLAKLAGVTPAVIGLTVVAVGTSLPELVVSVLAAVEKQPDIAMGNVVGSNIFNIAAALGVTALVFPLPVHGNAVRLEWPVMFLASLGCLVAARDGVVDRLEGGIALVALVLFISYTVRIARRDVTVSEAREIGAHVEDRDLDQPPSRTRARVVMPLVVLLGGVVALVIGGRLLVDGAVALARLAGMSERQIALTIVAGGTGAPELATSLVAAFRRRTDVAVANMIGSNIFNVLGILGVAAMVTPIPVSAGIIQSDLWWMIGTALLALPLLWSGRMLSRIEGAVLTTAYLTYVVLLLRS